MGVGAAVGRDKGVDVYGMEVTRTGEDPSLRLIAIARVSKTKNAMTAVQIALFMLTGFQ